MGKRMDYMLFPDGKRKAMTLSYDDGVVQDRRLVRILNQYNMKCTFNLGAGVLGAHEELKMGSKTVDVSKIDPDEVAALYADHEVAGHGLWHSSLANIGSPAAMYETIEDKRQLESLTGKIVRSFAYPFGQFNEQVKELLQLAGYQSARTVISSGDFSIPQDFMAWEATCHHNDPRLMELAKMFCEGDNRFPMAKLFYLWGHAYEFDVDDNWEVIEAFAQYVSQFVADIWFATNAEIVDYVTAYRALKYSADASMIMNPTSTEVWLGIAGQSIRIAPGETVSISDTGY